MTLGQLADHCREMATVEQDAPTREMWVRMAGEIVDYLGEPAELLTLPGL